MIHRAAPDAYDSLMEALQGARPKHSRILKKWGLRPGRKPEEHPLFSGTVLVLRQQEDLSFVQELRCIRFAGHFAEEAGRALPMGLMPGKFGMLIAMKRIGSKLWDIAVAYTDLDHAVVLFRTDGQPDILDGRVIDV